VTEASSPSASARGRPGRVGTVTISDVARHAGVAVSTVSYVLSGKRTISAVTRQRVLSSVRTLGYHPHAGARALASNRSNVIALVLPLRAGMHLPVLMQFTSAVVINARRYDHDVLLVTADEGQEGIRRVAASAMVDGLVLMDVEMHDRRVPLLRQLDQPSVLIGFPEEATGVTCVDLDFKRAGRMCVEHLAGLGHRDIALLGAPRAVYQRDTGFARRTKAGFSAAIKELGLRSAVSSCEEHSAAVRRTTAALLARRPELTAFVVHNEGAVGHVLAALAALGRRVPDDVSVLAICPDEVAERANPPLSSVLVPAEDVGRQAVEMLMRKLNGLEVEDATLLAPRLTPRASTARPGTPRASTAGPGTPAAGPGTPAAG
jgi:DNA-binding LacI/PurR family transcriptional regulator